MMTLPRVFDTCVPKPEVLAGELPDAIFAADLWAVVTGQAHQEYLDPNRFFAGTYPTDNLKVLVKEIVERLAGSEGRIGILCTFRGIQSREPEIPDVTPAKVRPVVTIARRVGFSYIRRYARWSG